MWIPIAASGFTVLIQVISQEFGLDYHQEKVIRKSNKVSPGVVRILEFWNYYIFRN